MKLYYFFILLISTTLLSGCKLTEEEIQAIQDSVDQEQNQPTPVVHPPLAQYCDEKTFYQPEAEISKKIDLLFIIDTSGSIYEERAQIGQGIDAFFDALPNDVDAQVAVMLGHVGKYSGRLYRKKRGEDFVLSTQKHSINSIKEVLSQRMKYPKSERASDGGEAGIYSLNEALKPENIERMRDRGFLRDNAALVITFIADENDICFEYPEGLTPAYDGDFLEAPAFKKYCGDINHKTVYKKLTQTFNDRPLLVSGILYNENSVFPKRGENEIGHGYLDMIRLGNGVTVDLSTKRYHEGLDRIATLAVKKLHLNTAFKLNLNNIEVETMYVKVDGADVKFIYKPETSEVHLTDYAGKENSEVYIRYCEKPKPTNPDNPNDNPGDGNPQDDNDNGEDPGNGNSDNDNNQPEPTLTSTGAEVSSLTGTTASINWTTNIPAKGYLQITNLATGNIFTTTDPNQMTKQHQVKAEGLTPNTLYKIVPISTTETQDLAGEEITIRTRR